MMGRQKGRGHQPPLPLVDLGRPTHSDPSLSCWPSTCWHLTLRESHDGSYGMARGCTATGWWQQSAAIRFSTERRRPILTPCGCFRCCNPHLPTCHRAPRNQLSEKGAARLGARGYKALHRRVLRHRRRSHPDRPTAFRSALLPGVGVD